MVGLELGADDDVVKPFSPRELVARVRTILRRSVRPARSLTMVPPAFAAESAPQPFLKPCAVTVRSANPGTRCAKRSTVLSADSTGVPTNPRRSLVPKAMNGVRNSIFEPASPCATSAGSKGAKPSVSAASSL